jgi:LacI family transcriptional regulator
MAEKAKTATITEVAGRAGVSIATVSRVMNGVARRATAETQARVWEAVGALGYRPQGAGQTLRQRQSRLVAVLASNLANPTMAAIAAGIETSLREAGLVMVLCDTRDRAELQDEYLLEMRAQAVRATVLLGAVSSPGLTRLAESGDPLLFVTREGPAPAFIGIDDHRAGADVAAFMLARHIAAPAAVHGSLASSATAARIAGFTQALAAAHAPIGPVVTLPGAEHIAIGYRMAEAALAQAPGKRGIFCASDLIAYGAHRRLAECGLHVPADVLLVGFDDNPLNDWIAPWLSSVGVPYDRFGPAVLAGLHHIWRGEHVRILLEHRMKARPV